VFTGPSGSCRRLGAFSLPAELPARVSEVLFAPAVKSDCLFGEQIVICCFYFA
jgi:hypothetical protein